HAHRRLPSLHSFPTRRSSDLADDLPDVQQPLDADLVLAPVPPFAAALGAAELAGRQRAVRLQAVADPVADALGDLVPAPAAPQVDRKSTRLNSSHVKISYAVF